MRVQIVHQDDPTGMRIGGDGLLNVLNMIGWTSPVFAERGDG
jgi:hypothetical protein